MIKLNESEKLNNTSVCIGNFDGLHIAHKALIDMANKEKGELKSVIYTFSPHPRKIFGKEHFSIQSDKEKEESLMEMGCDYLYIKETTKDFLSKSPSSIKPLIILLLTGTSFSFISGRTVTEKPYFSPSADKRVASPPEFFPNLKS